MEKSWWLQSYDFNVVVIKLIAAVLSTVLFILAIYLISELYKWKRLDLEFWTKQGIRYIKPSPILGSISLNGKPLHEQEMDMCQEYGEIHARYEGTRSVITIADPSLTWDVFRLFTERRDLKFNDVVFDNSLFAMENPDWRRVRSNFSPHFTTAKLKKIFSAAEQCVHNVMLKIDDSISENRSILCQRIFGNYFIDTIARCVYSTNIPCLQEDENEFVESAREAFICNKTWKSFGVLLFPKLMKFFRISLLNQKSVKFFRDMSIKLVDNRQKTNKRFPDFLQFALDTIKKDSIINSSVEKDELSIEGISSMPSTDSQAALPPKLLKHFRISLLKQKSVKFFRNMAVSISHIRQKTKVICTNFMQFTTNTVPEDSIGNICAEKDDSRNGVQSGNSKNSSEPSITQNELLAHVLSFILAGYEPTVSLISFALFNLAKYPTYQARAYDEVKTVLKKYEGQFSMDVVKELTWIDCILYECLRLCPSIVRVERKVEKDCNLNDIALRKGMLISVPIFVVHRNPHIFYEPEKFIPERFEGNPDLLKKCFLGFAQGARKCLGKNFVMMFVNLLFAKIILEYEICVGPETPDEVKIIENRNILKIEDLNILFRRRAKQDVTDSRRSSGEMQL